MLSLQLFWTQLGSHGITEVWLVWDSSEVRKNFLEKVTPELDLEGSVRNFQVDKGENNFLDGREKPVQGLEGCDICHGSTDLSL